MTEMTIQEIFDQVESVTIYHNGLPVQLLPAQMSYKLVINGFKNLLVNSRRMPAFGVSLDNETRQAMLEGVWVEFDFGKTIYFAEMSFERLLMQAVASREGFNLIRYNAKGGYAGRCYYFDLDGTMSEFCAILKSV